MTPAPARAAPPTSSCAWAIRSRSSGALGSVVVTTSSPTSSHSTLSSARTGAAYAGTGGRAGSRHRRQHGDGREPAGYSHGFPLARTGGHRASDTDRLTPRSKSSTHGSGTTGGSTSANPRLAATSGPTSG